MRDSVGVDLYEELEVSPRASAEVIRAAYRRLARKFHPDAGLEANAERMVRLTKAYEVLSNEERRAEYEAGRGRHRRRPPPSQAGSEADRHPSQPAVQATVRLSLDVPPLPAPHMRVLSAIADPEAGADVAAVVESDPALTAAVLRAANSAASAPRTPITTARRAIVRIGMLATGQIVAAVVVRQSFPRLSRASLDADELWRHVIACALLADAGAERKRLRTAAFTAGLLHDVGRLVLATSDPQRYSLVVERARGGENTLAVEDELFGVNHTSVAPRVCAKWHIPGEIQEAIVDHHDGAGSALGRVTRNARHLAFQLGIGDGVLSGTDPREVSRLENDRTISALGGIRRLQQKIDWYRLAGRVPASGVRARHPRRRSARRRQ